MNKTQIPSEQEQNRLLLLTILQNSDWKLRNLKAYNADFSLAAELSARKRNSHCIMELNISYENKYFGIAVANFQAGRAEYLVYFDGLRQTEEIVQYILKFSPDMTVKKSIDMAKQLCDIYKDNVFFFNGEESEKINAVNVNFVFNKNQ